MSPAALCLALLAVALAPRPAYFSEVRFFAGGGGSAPATQAAAPRRAANLENPAAEISGKNGLGGGAEDLAPKNTGSEAILGDSAAGFAVGPDNPEVTEEQQEEFFAAWRALGDAQVKRRCGEYVAGEHVHVGLARSPMVLYSPMKVQRETHDKEKIIILLVMRLGDHPKPIAEALCRLHLLSNQVCLRLEMVIKKAIRDYDSVTREKQSVHHLYIGNELVKAGEPCQDIADSFHAALQLDENLPKQAVAQAAALLFSRHCNAEGMEFARAAYWKGSALSSDGGPPDDQVVEDANSFQVKWPLTTRHRLRHDKLQLEYLLGHVLPESKDECVERRAVLERALAAFEDVLADVTASEDVFRYFVPNKPGQGSTLAYTQPLLDKDQVELSPAQWRKLSPYYNRNLFFVDTPRLEGPAISNIPKQAAEERYLDQGVIFLDNFLTPDALDALRKFSHGSTVWRDNKRSYLGAYFTHGVGMPLFAQISEELTKALPGIFCNHKLHHGWGYKYDDVISSGIDAHGDEAAVNVNFWIAEDENNLGGSTGSGEDGKGSESAVDPSTRGDYGGGLVIFTASSKGMSFERYNVAEEDVKLALLAESDFRNVTIPYKSNRVVIFRSDLFHSTDRFHFKKGYTTRRINYTLLYGDAAQSCQDSFLKP